MTDTWSAVRVDWQRRRRLRRRPMAGRLKDWLDAGYDSLYADPDKGTGGCRCRTRARRRSRDLRAGIDDVDYGVHFRNVLRLKPVFECGVEASWGRLLDNDRLWRRKLDLGNWGNLGDWRLWRQDEG